MERLNAQLLKTHDFPKDIKIHQTDSALPEKIIQFGEGNFLRAFVDWIFTQLNDQKLFNGRAVVVQPIAQGMAAALNEQDGLYTLLLRGIEDGKFSEQREIISIISRALNPYGQWNEVLECAENPDLEIVVSNTTEAGITFDEKDRLDNVPPDTYPGKLTAFLFHRWKHFGGDTSKGMIVIPCELIEDNGKNLRKEILRFADSWALPGEFKLWVQDSCTFISTLVDRVVTGYPRDDAAQLEQSLGYKDTLMDTAESFYLWVLEGPESLEERLPFRKAGLHVVWTDDQRPYRNRKVRILNGAHTGAVPASFFCGLDTVKDMMEDETTGRYVSELLYGEILNAFADDSDTAAIKALADAVMDRFRNPAVRHYLLSIMLNSSSKFAVRDLPSLLDYVKMHGTLPKKLVFSLAALLSVYRSGRLENGVLKIARDGKEYDMRDDAGFLDFAKETWSKCGGSDEAYQAAAERFLAKTDVWGTDLNCVPGLTEAVGKDMAAIAKLGMREAMKGTLD